MKLLSFLFSLIISACTTIHPTTVEDLNKVTVKVLSDKHGGGSGVIFKSTPKGSIILTNAHICKVISTGGYVYNGDSYVIKNYKVSTKHDICYIFVKEFLGVSTDLSRTPPKRHSEIMVTGHPSLYPHVVSRGHISGTRTIGITVDYRACTKEEEAEDPFNCVFEGKNIVVHRQATLVSALISPGSSGSGVFNKKGELVGLAFAAAGDINYGEIVPWKFLKEFVEADAKSIKWETPGPDKKQVEYKNKGMEDIENWRKFFDIIRKRNQCLKFCP